MMMMKSRPTNVKVYAQASKPSPASVLRKKIEAKRSTQLKENFNKLTMIATADTKFLTDTLTELDVLHKGFFEKYMKPQNVPSDVNDDDISVVDDENIFLSK